MMLVECATTSTNNGSTCSTSATTATSAITTYSTNATPPTIICAKTTAPTVPATAALCNSSQDGLSSGSNSCSNSIGNSISTNSNSISNSNSIGTSWRVGSSSSGIGECNGRGSIDKNCTSSVADLDCSFRGNEFVTHVRSGDFSKSTPNCVRTLHPMSSTTGYKYGSPLSDLKYCKKDLPNRDNSKMVDVEACLANTPPHLLIRSLSSLSHHSSQLSTLPRSPEQEQSGSQTLQKGVLQQARDRLFSRWKERYFVLTRDYLACFRRGSTKYSEMGSFIFKVNLASVEGVWWEERRGGAVVAVGLPREGRVLLRPRQHDHAQLQIWHRALLDATTASRLRRTALRRGTSTTHLHLTATSQGGESSSSECGGDDSSCSSQLGPHSNTTATRQGCAPGSLDTDPPSTPPSSLTSSHKFSTTTSSGSGCGSSVASSPSLGNYNPPGGWSPRSRFSLVESPRRILTSSPAAAGQPKTRHSLCIDPQELTGGFRGPLRSGPRSPGGVLGGGPSSLSGTPSRVAGGGLTGRRLTPSPGSGQGRRSLCLDSLSTSRTSLLSLTPRNPLLDLLENSPSPIAASPVASSTNDQPLHVSSTLSTPRTRASLTLFRNSPLFN